MALETELKLRLPPNRNAAFRRLLANQALSAVPPVTLVSVYYDTPSLALMQRDMGLRLRQVDGQWLQTLKLAEQAGAGLHQRPELEEVVSGPALELDRITDRKARRFLTKDTIAPVLAPLFTTTIKRSCWTVQDEQGNTLEVCLDQGTIEGREQTVKVNEVEIELKQGQVPALFELALKLAGSLPLIPDPQSKAERGYALYRDTAPLTPSKAQLPALSATMTPQQALRTVVQETLRHLQANTPGILDGDDMECVHQARVALRRLRSTQKAFAAIVPDDAWSGITPEVQWLATVLGQLRDLDVFLAETLPGIEAALAPDGGDFTALRSAMLARREHGREAARAALTSARYGALLLRLLAWLNQSATAPKKPVKLRRFAHRALDRRWQPVDRLARKWDELDQEQRHDLRKRAKKMRYASEFFSPLYQRKQVMRYLKRLQALQLILGEMNDSVAAQALLADFSREDASLERAAGLVAGWLAHGARLSEARLARALKRLENTEAFW